MAEGGIRRKEKSLKILKFANLAKVAVRARHDIPGFRQLCGLNAVSY
jgi:hypothetical protein